MEVETRDEFVNKLAVACHVLVSLAHVVIIVDHNSAKDTLAVFVKEVVGLEVLIILFVGYWLIYQLHVFISIADSKIINHL